MHIVSVANIDGMHQHPYQVKLQQKGKLAQVGQNLHKDFPLRGLYINLLTQVFKPI